MSNRERGRSYNLLPIGPIQTATILAAIGTIENFPNAGSLKSYCGWSPTVVQSGTTLDSTKQTRGGTRTMKQMMFLIVSNLINRDTEWPSSMGDWSKPNAPLIHVQVSEQENCVSSVGSPASSLRPCMRCSKRMSKS
ncbi:transposase [Reticulibacter mediterranei]|uniref:transposase n=1 Tax=Reticulibacter mediterranei TaxID=2778369 RepID=UPI001C68C6E8|nr:transposase [Reticulibacter mediterranei]